MGRKINNKSQDSGLKQEIFGVVTCFCSVLLAYGVFSRGHSGAWGNAIVNFFFGLLGNVAYIFPFFMLIFGIQLITKSAKKRNRFFKFSMFFMLSISFLLFLINEQTVNTEIGFTALVKNLYMQGQIPTGGGVVSIFAAPFIKFF